MKAFITGLAIGVFIAAPALAFGLGEKAAPVEPQPACVDMAAELPCTVLLEAPDSRN